MTLQSPVCDELGECCETDDEVTYQWSRAYSPHIFRFAHRSNRKRTKSFSIARRFLQSSIGRVTYLLWAGCSLSTQFTIPGCPRGNEMWHLQNVGRI
jgi:hypothetical protein